MNEKIIELENMSPSEFFGPHNRNIELVKKSFPKLKIVPRGNKVRVYGEAIMLDEFEKKFNSLSHIQKN